MNKKNKHNKTKKNKKWPIYYGIILDKSILENYKRTDVVEGIIHTTETILRASQEAVRVGCDWFYDRRKSSLVFFSVKNWDLDPKLAKYGIKIKKIKNRGAFYETIAYILKFGKSDKILTDPETGQPCTLKEFASAEARRSDN